MAELRSIVMHAQDKWTETGLPRVTMDAARFKSPLLATG